MTSSPDIGQLEPGLDNDQDQTESWQIYPETWAEVPSLEASWHCMDNLESS